MKIHANISMHLPQACASEVASVVNYFTVSGVVKTTGAGNVQGAAGY